MKKNRHVFVLFCFVFVFVCTSLNLYRFCGNLWSKPSNCTDAGTDKRWQAYLEYLCNTCRYAKFKNLSRATVANGSNMMGRRGGCPKLSAFLMRSTMFIIMVFWSLNVTLGKNMPFGVVATTLTTFWRLEIVLIWSQHVTFMSDHRHESWSSFTQLPFFKNWYWKQPLQDFVLLFRCQFPSFGMIQVVSR